MAQDQPPQPDPAAPEETPTLNYATARTPNPRDALKLVVIATFANLWEAHLARGELEAAGITAVLDGENLIGGVGTIYGSIVGGVKLRVPSIDAERALGLLPRRVRGRIIKCPKCAGIETREIDFSPGVKMLFLLLLGLPYLFVQKPWACITCGNVWHASKDDEEYDDADDEEDENDSEDEDSKNAQEDTNDHKPV